MSNCIKNNPSVPFLTGFLYLFALVMFCSECEAEPVRPAVELSGTTTMNGVVTVKWSGVSVDFTGKEIEKAFNLWEGDLYLMQQIHSKTSGLPVVDWYCRCDDDSQGRHRLHLSAELRAKQMVVSQN